MSGVKEMAKAFIDGSGTGKLTSAAYEREIASLRATALQLHEALEMVRDADEDCKRDGLPRVLPPMARAKVDLALAAIDIRRLRHLIYGDAA